MCAARQQHTTLNWRRHQRARRWLGSRCNCHVLRIAHFQIETSTCIPSAKADRAGVGALQAAYHSACACLALACSYMEMGRTSLLLGMSPGTVHAAKGLQHHVCVSWRAASGGGAPAPAGVGAQLLERAGAAIPPVALAVSPWRFCAFVLVVTIVVMITIDGGKTTT